MMKYTDSHEWCRLENGIATVGITEFAQQELGEIVFVELPKVGSYLNQFREAAVLESTKAASDVYSPLSGQVLEVNEELINAPQLINQQSERGGWLFRMKPHNLEEMDILKTWEEYSKNF